MTEKMKSVCALGRKPHCACPPPMPDPDEVARAQPDQRLHHLVARARRVCRGVDEGEQPGPAVRRGHRHDQGQAGQGGQHLHHRTQTDPRDEQQGQGDDSRAPSPSPCRVGPGSGRRPARWPVSAGPMMRRSLASSSRRRVMRSAAKSDQGQLHQLRRLEPELAEADPAARAHGVHAEPRDQHHEEEAHEGDQEQRGSPAAAGGSRAGPCPTARRSRWPST